MLVDSHCHLNHLDLRPYGGELQAALEAARAVGVSELLCVALNREQLPEVLAIAVADAGIYASVGMHPLERADLGISLAELIDLANHAKIVAIGETGLDYHYADNFEQQRQSFRTHLQAASQCRKPVIVHTRAAAQDTITLLREHLDPEVGGVMHCFTESWEMARAALDLGLYLSFAGIITFANAEPLRQVVSQTPLDRLLIETDSPYLAPVPHRGRKNEPKYLPAVAQQVAELKGISIDEVARITRENFRRLFRLG